MKHIKRSKIGREKEKKKRVELKFLSKFRVMLYIRYSYYITLYIIKGHLRNRKVYKGVRGKKIKEIKEQIIGLEGLVIYIEDIRYPNYRSLGVKEIEVFLGSYVYYQQVREGEGDKITYNYRFIGGSKRVIQEHRRKAYSQVNILKKGRRKNSKEREIFQRSSVKFQ